MSDTLVAFTSEEWMPVGVAARLLELSPQRVRQLIESGALPCAETPLGRLVHRDEVERLRVKRRRGG